MTQYHYQDTLRFHRCDLWERIYLGINEICTQLHGDIPLTSYLKFFFFLLLLKYHFSNWTNYSYAKVIVFAELLSIFNIISLSLFGWYSNYEGQLSSLFLQIALLTVRVEVTLPWLVSCRDPLYSVPRTLQFLFFSFSFYLGVPWENGLFSVDPCQKLISGGRVITVIVRLSCLYRLVKCSIQWGRWIVYSLGDYIVVLIHLEPRFLFREVNVR